MDINELISKWQNLIVGIVIVLALIYGSYTYIYKPQLKEINGLTNSLKMIDTEIRSLGGGDMLQKDTESVRALIKKELDALEKKIPMEVETPYLIDNFISIVGSGLNIDYNLIQPSAVVVEQRYKRLPLNVEFNGDYVDLNSYLSQLKKLPVTIRVDMLQLHKLADSRKLTVRMALSAFVLPGGEQKPPGAKTEYPLQFDPFYSLLGKAGGTQPVFQPLKGLKYSGYYLIGDQIKAIINDETLKIGGSIQGFTLLRIYRNKVLLGKGKSVYELGLEKAK